jgi:glycosyltransferase involved in cell wall biosynthesis
MGVLEHKEVANVFRAHDLFFFPTHGENYGHVIMESLLAGTPVLISNTTPWLNLDKAGIGWDLPLDNMAEFVDKIHLSAQLSNKLRIEWRKRVRSFALDQSTDPDILAAHRSLFLSTLKLTCGK